VKAKTAGKPALALEVWCVVHPYRHPITWTAMACKSDATGTFTSDDEIGRTWAEFKRQGYTVQKFTLTPVEDPHA